MGVRAGQQEPEAAARKYGAAWPKGWRWRGQAVSRAATGAVRGLALGSTPRHGTLWQSTRFEWLFSPLCVAGPAWPFTKGVAVKVG